MHRFPKSTLVVMMASLTPLAWGYDIPETQHTIPNTLSGLPLRLTNGVTNAILTPEKPHEKLILSGVRAAELEPGQSIVIRTQGDVDLSGINPFVVYKGGFEVETQGNMIYTPTHSALGTDGFVDRFVLKAGEDFIMKGSHLMSPRHGHDGLFVVAGKRMVLEREDGPVLSLAQAGEVKIGDETTESISMRGSVDWDPKEAGSRPSTLTLHSKDQNTFVIPSNRTFVHQGNEDDTMRIVSRVNTMTFEGTGINAIESDASTLEVGSLGTTKINRIDASTRERLVQYGVRNVRALLGHLAFYADELNDVKVKSLLHASSAGGLRARLTMVAGTNLVTMSEGCGFVNPAVPKPMTMVFGDDAGVTKQNILVSQGTNPAQHAAIFLTNNQEAKLTAQQANVVVGGFMGVRFFSDGRRPDPQAKVTMKAPRNVLQGGQDAVFIGNTLPETQPSLEIEGGVNIKGQRYALNLFNGNAHLTTTDLNTPLTLTPPVAGLEVPPTSTLEGDILAIQGTLSVVPKDPLVDGHLHMKTPRMVNVLSSMEIGLGPESSLMGSSTFMSVFRNAPRAGRKHALTLHTPTSRWFVMQDETTPVDITPMWRDLVNHGEVVMSPPSQGGTVLWVHRYDGDGTFVVQVDKDKTKSDLIVVADNQSAKPSRLVVRNGDTVTLAEGERIPVAYAGGARLFEENSIAYTKPAAKGALTTTALKVTSRPNREEQLDYTSEQVIPQRMVWPVVSEINPLVGDITVVPGELPTNVGALTAQATDPSTLTNYYLESTLVDVEVTPEVPTLAALNFDLTMGRMDSLSKRRGMLVSDTPLWARTSYYEVGQKGSFKLHNQSLELGYDVVQNPMHRVSVAISGLRGKAKMDRLSGQGKAHQMGLHAYYTYGDLLSTYVDVHAFVNRVKDKMQYVAQDSSTLDGQYHHTNLGASVEVGHAFSVGNHRLIPQAQVQVTHLGGAHWTDGVSSYDLKRTTSVMGRLGLDYRYRFTLGSGLAWESSVAGHVYYEARGKRDLEAQDLLRRVSVTTSRRGAWSSVALGLNGQIAKRCVLNANLERGWGRHHNRAWEANLGLAWGW